MFLMIFGGFDESGGDLNRLGVSVFLDSRLRGNDVYLYSHGFLCGLCARQTTHTCHTHPHKHPAQAPNDIRISS